MNQMTAYCVVGREFNHLKLEILLKKSEFKVIFFTNALNALTRCLEDIPDVVFLYNGIDDLNWNEFLKSFRKVNAHTPVIVITPNNSQYVRTTALKSGATDIYSHSLLSEEFTARFSMILNLCLQNKELETKSILLDSEIKKVTQRVRESEWETLMVLAKAAEYKDAATERHTERVSQYSHLLAKSIGLPPEEQEIIYYSASLHDIGKIGIPDSVLMKKSEYTFDEFEIMKNHTNIGFSILENTNSKYLYYGKYIALYHHERYDGNGYPNGARGTGIPLAARIVSIADVFDALTTKRTYKNAWSIKQATDYLLNQKGKQFDSQLVDFFVEQMDEILRIHSDTHSNRIIYGNPALIERFV